MRKGSHQTEEAKKKNSEKHLGKTAWNKGKKIGNLWPNSGQFKKGHSPWHKGKKDVYSEETRRKMGEPKKGKPNWRKGVIGVYKYTDAQKKALSDLMRSKHIVASEERKRKISDANRGENNGQWKGGITPIHGRIRNSHEYKLWRRAVYERDKYTCVWCGDNRGGNLEADHIKPFADYPELRFAIDNGRTLCKSCHQKTDTYGGKYNRKKHE